MTLNVLLTENEQTNIENELSQPLVCTVLFTCSLLRNVLYRLQCLCCPNVKRNRRSLYEKDMVSFSVVAIQHWNYHNIRSAVWHILWIWIHIIFIYMTSVVGKDHNKPRTLWHRPMDVHLMCWVCQSVSHQQPLITGSACGLLTRWWVKSDQDGVSVQLDTCIRHQVFISYWSIRNVIVGGAKHLPSELDHEYMCPAIHLSR